MSRISTVNAGEFGQHGLHEGGHLDGRWKHIIGAGSSYSGCDCGLYIRHRGEHDHGPRHLRALRPPAGRVRRLHCYDHLLCVGFRDGNGDIRVAQVQGEPGQRGDSAGGLHRGHRQQYGASRHRPVHVRADPGVSVAAHRVDLRVLQPPPAVGVHRLEEQVHQDRPHQRLDPRHLRPVHKRYWRYSPGPGRRLLPRVRGVPADRERHWGEPGVRAVVPAGHAPPPDRHPRDPAGEH